MSLNGSDPTPGLGSGYEPIALLSRGNDFDVYDAWSFERGCRVIVKTVRDDLLGDRGRVQRLLSEGRLLTSLGHPHIVRGYDVREGGPRPIIVIETLGGETLAHLIRAGGLLEDDEAAQLGLQIGSAVRYLHALGILHLDLKPSNVIAENGRARLIDLGLATEPGPVKKGLGTWCYQAPEQARGGVVGPAADVWGLGATLYEALSGWPPFDDPEREIDGLMDEEIEFPQLERLARPLAEVSAAGPELAHLVDCCLLPEVEMRPTLAFALERLEAMAGVETGQARFATRSRL
jgi:serine/threonine protein kinase